MKSERPPFQSPHNLHPCAVRDCFLQHTLPLNIFQHGHGSRYGKHTAVQIYMAALNSKSMKQKNKNKKNSKRKPKGCKCTFEVYDSVTGNRMDE